MPIPKMPDAVAEYCKNHAEAIENLLAATPTNNSDAYDELQKKCQELLEEKQQALSYDNNTPLPGIPVSDEMIQNVESEDSLKENADKMLLANAAREKMKRERARPLEERLREYTIKSIVDEQKRQFFAKYGYQMSGRKIREATRHVTRKYDKGEIIKTPKQREDIIAAMDSPLNMAQNAPAQYNPGVSNKTSKSPVQPGSGILY